MKKLVLAFASLAVLATTAYAQIGPGKPIDFGKPVEVVGPRPAIRPEMGPIPCPNEDWQSIAPAAASARQNQFTPAVWALPRAVLNDTVQNRMFLHTFDWKDDGCCQVMQATVTVRLRALTGASSRTASDAGNDTISLWHNGTQLAASGGYIWPLGTTAGTVTTRTIPLTPAMLASINTNNTLSISVQDDTSVESVQLNLGRCCVKRRR